MDSITRKINVALAKKDMKRVDLAAKINMKTSNLSTLLDRDTYKTDVLEKMVKAIGYKLEINFIDEETGEKI